MQAYQNEELKSLTPELESAVSNLHLNCKSVGVYVSAKVLELRHTIKLIQILDGEIAEIEERIQNYMQEIHSPINWIIVNKVDKKLERGEKFIAVSLFRFEEIEKSLDYGIIEGTTFGGKRLYNV